MSVNRLKSLSPEVQDLVDDEDFLRALKYLAMDFGANATLDQVKRELELHRPLHEKVVNGISYTPGYKGPFMIQPGVYSSQLVEISSTGGVVKLMFAFEWENGGAPTTIPGYSIANRFLYCSIPKDHLDIDDVVSLSSQIGESFITTVSKSVIQATGEYHASVSEYKLTPQTHQ